MAKADGQGSDCGRGEGGLEWSGGIQRGRVGEEELEVVSYA